MDYRRLEWDSVNTTADRGDICRMHSRGGNEVPLYISIQISHVVHLT